MGDGDRAHRLQQRRAELDARGWFDETHKQELPRFPSQIGVVTSLDGDARYDIEEAIHTRDPTVDMVVADARVQDDRAAASIATAIQTLDRQHDVDVIVVGRGGGSDTDLAAFDSEGVAEAVFTAETPIVAAVGHREDEPIVNDVADATAITPTDVGAVVVEEREAIDQQLDQYAERVATAFQRLVEDELSAYETRVEAAFEGAAEQQLSALEDRVKDAYNTRERALARRRTRRKYGAIIALLLLVLVVMGAYIAFTLL